MLKDRAQISTTRMLIQRHRVGPEYLNQQGSQGIDGLLKGPHFEKHELRKGTKERRCLPRGEVFFPVPIIPTIPYCPHASATIPNSSIHITHLSWRGFEIVT